MLRQKELKTLRKLKDEVNESDANVLDSIIERESSCCRYGWVNIAHPVRLCWGTDGEVFTKLSTGFAELARYRYEYGDDLMPVALHFVGPDMVSNALEEDVERQLSASEGEDVSDLMGTISEYFKERGE